MPKRKRLGEQNAELGVLENHDYFMVSLPNFFGLFIHQPGLIDMIIWISKLWLVYITYFSIFSGENDD